jgi:hypothetical protein
MDSTYYTAKEARELLGMTHSALLNQVVAGNLQRIIPPGRRQGVYLKEEVDQLKREMDSWLINRRATKKEPARFVKATIDDMPDAVALADAVFGSHLTIPLKKRIEWLKKNPDIDYLLKQEGQIVGYFSLAPLRSDTIEDLLNQRRYASDLTARDILPYEPGVPVELYGLAIGVRPGVSLSQKREWGMALILGARQVLLDLGKRGVVIARIWAHSSKPDGIRLMRHAGFTETVSTVPGMRDFLIEVEPSGLPFLLEYKEALTSYQEGAASTVNESHVHASSDRAKRTNSRRHT